jgi:chromosomal replication initiator protein
MTSNSAIATKNSTQNSEEIWVRCLQQLSQIIPENQVYTWLKPVQMEWDGVQPTVTLWVANRFKLDWIRSQYLKQIIHTIQSQLNSAVDIILALRPQEPNLKVRSNIVDNNTGSNIWMY